MRLDMDLGPPLNRLHLETGVLRRPGTQRIVLRVMDAPKDADYWELETRMNLGGWAEFRLVMYSTRVPSGTPGGSLRLESAAYVGAEGPSRNGRPVELHGFPRVWSLLPFILSHRVRREAYEPAHEELKQDYLEAYAIVEGVWDRRWVTFAFTVRTVLMVLDCLRVAMGAKAWDALAKAVPYFVRKWLGG